jgi:hypothetical protein
MLHANVDRDQLLATLAPLCQGIDRDILQDFVTRMDPDYFSAFSAEHTRRAHQASRHAHTGPSMRCVH